MDSPQSQSTNSPIAFIGISGHIGQSWITFSGQNTLGFSRGNRIKDKRLVSQVTGLDITDGKRVHRELARLASLGVQTVINGAGEVNVNIVELERGREDLSAFRVNVEGAVNVAKACRKVGVKLIHLSTKAVLPEEMPSGYPEIILPDDSGAYTNSAPTWYGVTKAMGEREVAQNYSEGSVIVRLENVHGRNSMQWGGTAQKLAKGETVTRVNDMFGAHLTDKTVIQRLVAIEQALHTSKLRRKVYHIGARTILTPYEAGLQIAKQLGVDEASVIGMSQAEYVASMEQTAVPVISRPGYCYLNVAKCEEDFGPLPTVKEEIRKYLMLYGKELGVSK